MTDIRTDRYRAAWAAPGALTAMINWYRAFMRRDLRLSSGLRIKLPVLLIWASRIHTEFANLPRTACGYATMDDPSISPAPATGYTMMSASDAAKPSLISRETSARAEVALNDARIVQSLNL